MEGSVRIYSLDEVLSERLPIGRSLLFQELKSGRLRSVKIGRRTLVTERALEEYVRLLESEAVVTSESNPTGPR